MYKIKKYAKLFFWIIKMYTKYTLAVCVFMFYWFFLLSLNKECLWKVATSTGLWILGSLIKTTVFTLLDACAGECVQHKKYWVLLVDFVLHYNAIINGTVADCVNWWRHLGPATSSISGTVFIFYTEVHFTVINFNFAQWWITANISELYWKLNKYILIQNFHEDGGFTSYFKLIRVAVN